MSSRGEFVGSGPTAGIYQPRPIPLDTEDLPVYINDELLQLGGRVNEVFEGGAFPPQSALPQRWRDGMMIYYTSELPDVYPNGDRKDEQIITSAGVWLYKQEEWWKIIDDPTAIIGGVYVYKLTSDGTAPSTPLDSPEVPPDGWLKTPPEKTDKSEYIWVSTLAGLNDTTGIHTWSIPTIWSAGVVDEELEGGSVEQRFLAGSVDVVPIIDDVNARYPTSGGVDLTLTIPPTSPPAITMIYVSTASVGSVTDEIKIAWSDMVPYSTPDNTQTTRAWATAANWDESYPSFSPTEPGLPGPDWSYEQPAENRSRPLWMTERLEFLNGTPQTVWTTPMLWGSEQGTGTEFRYLAWYDNSTAPVVDDPSARVPYESGGTAFTLEQPNTTGEFPYIWKVSGSIGVETDELQGLWSEAVLFATPESTTIGRCWATADNWEDGYPSFTPTEEGLPGPDWTRIEELSQPPSSTEFPVWVSDRVEWNDNTAVGVWTTPANWNSEEGSKPEFRYIEWGSTTVAPVVADPTIRIPTAVGGGTFDIIQPPTSGVTPFLWKIEAAIGVGTDKLLDEWSAAVLFVTPESTGMGRCWGTALTWEDPYPTFDPAAPDLPGTDWTRLEDSAQPPYTRDYPVWVSDRIEWPDLTKVTNWTTPARWNSEKGSDGVPGVPGDNGLRGTVNLLDPTDRTVWDNQEAWDLVTAHVAGQVDPKNKLPIVGDVVTQQDKTSTDDSVFVESRSLITAVAPGTWIVADHIIDGNLIVQGTIAGEDIYASSRITIGSGEDVVILDGTSTEARIWVGSQTATSGNFMVDPNGNMSCNNATFAGNVTSGSTITGAIITGGQMTVGAGFAVDTAGNMTATGADISGTLAADAITTTSGNFAVDTGGNMSASSASINGDITTGSTITGSVINGGQITIGTDFAVDTAGKMTASGASIDGSLAADSISTTSGNFSVDTGGNMACTNATFAGNVTSTATITGGTINSAQMNSGNGNFIVDSVGNMICNDATINGVLSGPLISEGSGKLIGSEIHVPKEEDFIDPGNFTGFHVSGAGNLYAQDGVFKGTVYAENLEGDIVTNARLEPSLFYKTNITGGGINFDHFIISIDPDINYERSLSIEAEGWAVMSSDDSASTSFLVDVSLNNVGYEVVYTSPMVTLDFGMPDASPIDYFPGYQKIGVVKTELVIPPGTAPTFIKFRHDMGDTSNGPDVRWFFGGSKNDGQNVDRWVHIDVYRITEATNIVTDHGDQFPLAADPSMTRDLSIREEKQPDGSLKHYLGSREIDMNSLFIT